MIRGINGVYPTMSQWWATASDIQRARKLLWEIPDGKTGWTAAAGITQKNARVAATRAILNYLGSAAKKHPDMRNQLYNKAPSF